MYAQVEKPKENKSRAAANAVAQKKSDVKQGFGFVDNRPETVAQRILQKIANNNSQVATTQLKPKNIKDTHTLNVDNAGLITNAEAGRVDPPVSYPLNTAIDLGLLNSKSGAAVGGHMFKREYGGLDNYTNVVTWSEKSEQSFTDFENEYLVKARADASGKGGVARQVKTNATFTNHRVNLNDVKLADKVKPDGTVIDNRTIRNASTSTDTKAARHLLTKVISGAMESIPEAVTVTSKGVEPWSKTGKSGFMKVTGEINETQVANRFDYIADNVGGDKARVERAAAKVDEM